MIEIKIRPIPKPRMTRSDRWKKRSCVVRYYNFKDQLKEAMKNIDVENLFSSYFHMTFTFKTSKFWSKKKTEQMIGNPHDQKPDIDNIVKSVFDSLLKEDKFVWDFRATKVWGNEDSIKIHKKLTNGFR